MIQCILRHGPAWDCYDKERQPQKITLHCEKERLCTDRYVDRVESSLYRYLVHLSVFDQRGTLTLRTSQIVPVKISADINRVIMIQRMWSRGAQSSWLKTPVSTLLIMWGSVIELFLFQHIILDGRVIAMPGETCSIIETPLADTRYNPSCFHLFRMKETFLMRL